MSHHAYVTFKFQRKPMGVWSSGGLAVSASRHNASAVLLELKQKLQVDLIEVLGIEWTGQFGECTDAQSV